MNIKTHEGRCAVFSDCGKYRYLLRSVWRDEWPRVAFLMLNPSTADEMINDPTVARCEKRAVREGYGSFSIINLFAYRATDPRDMLSAVDPVGEMNDATIVHEASRASRVYLAWGVNGAKRAGEVLNLLASAGLSKRLWALRTTKHGHPCHPLYLPDDLEPHEYAWQSKETVPVPHEPEFMRSVDDYFASRVRTMLF